MASEAYELTGVTAKNTNDMTSIAYKILSLGANSVLLKGGHLTSHKASDLYIDSSGKQQWLELPRIATENTHGTGCTLSSAIAASLAIGMDLSEACMCAKYYLHNALKAAQNDKVGIGAGPVHHFYHLWPTIYKIKAP